MKYKIWQLRNSMKNRKLMFLSLGELKELGYYPDDLDYEVKWESDTEGLVADGFAINERNARGVLGSIFIKFNVDRPDGFEGHSLSVSDVIELGGRAYYVDPKGFEEINNFEGGKYNESNT